MKINHHTTTVPTLTERQLREISHLYDLTPIPAHSLVRSWTNDVFLLETGRHKYILKIYGLDWRSESAIRYEIDLLSHLARRGVAVAQAIAGRSGDSLHRLAMPEGLRTAVLFRYAPGVKPKQPFTPALYRRFGEIVARMHNGATGFGSDHQRPPLDLEHYFSRPLRIIRPYFAARPHDWDFLNQIAEECCARITELTAGADWGVCHGDVSLDNIHVAPDGRITLYDFDSGGEGWRAADFEGILQSAWQHGNYERWDAFVAGYTAIRNLSGEDLATVPYFTPAQEIWGMGIDLDYERRTGKSRIDDTYFERRLMKLRQWQTQVKEIPHRP